MFGFGFGHAYYFPINNMHGEIFIFTLPENVKILICYVYVVAVLCKLSLWAQTIARTHTI